MTATHAIPEATAERFVTTLTALVTGVREAVAGSSSAQAGAWRRKILPQLEGRLDAARRAQAQFAIGDEQGLVDAALPLRFLARDLDGYSLDFAGADAARQYEERRRLVVYAAWQVGQAAGAV
jgi:hypothetical protein